MRRDIKPSMESLGDRIAPSALALVPHATVLATISGQPPRGVILPIQKAPDGSIPPAVSPADDPLPGPEPPPSYPGGEPPIEYPVLPPSGPAGPGAVTITGA
jgi:hypothetical protein